MILTGDEIIKQQACGGIVIDPFNAERVNPNSYNLTLHQVLGYYQPWHGCKLDMKVDHDINYITLNKYGLTLEPGRIYLGMTNEACGSDRFVTCLEGRSSVGRLGMQVHLTAGFGDLGFKSQWTLEISVVQPLCIYPNIEICQAIFYAVTGTVGDRLYNGKYVRQDRPTGSKLWQEFLPPPLRDAREGK